MFTQGQFTNLSSLIVSYVRDEADIFIESWADTPEALENFLHYALPHSRKINLGDAIEDHYPVNGDETARLKQVMQDSMFVCNVRQLYNAYKGKTYVMQYFLPPMMHGSDLLPLTYRYGLDAEDVLKSFVKNLDPELPDLLDRLIGPFAFTYQKYLVAHAMFGDPNRVNHRSDKVWNIANEDNGTINNALQAGVSESSPFDSGTDEQISTENCESWKEVAQKLGDLPPEEKNSGDEPGVFNQLSGVQVQEPEKGTLVIPEL